MFYYTTIYFPITGKQIKVIQILVTQVAYGLICKDYSSKQVFVCFYVHSSQRTTSHLWDFFPLQKKKILRVFEQSELSLPLPIQFLTLCQHRGTSGSSQDSSLLCSEDGAEKYTLWREIKGLKITCFLAFEQQQNEIFFCKKRKVQLRYKQQHWEILNGNNLPFTGF